VSSWLPMRNGKWAHERKSHTNIRRRLAVLLVGISVSSSSSLTAEILVRPSNAVSPAGQATFDNAVDPSFAGYINVRAFGAKGDGITDDTAAFRKAIANVPPGSTIFVPPGIYHITQDISYPATRSISWKGTGYGSVLSFNGSGIILTGGEEAVVKRLSIEALRIQRRGTAGAALALNGTDSAGLSRWILRDLHIVSVGGTGIYIEGAWLGAMDNVMVMRSKIGVQIEMNRESRNTSMNALTVTGGEVQGCTDGWRIKAVAGLTMRGHAVEGNVRGITASHTPRGINIDGGYFEHNTAYDILFDGPTAGYGNSIRDSLFFSPGGGRATPSPSY